MCLWRKLPFLNGFIRNCFQENPTNILIQDAAFSRLGLWGKVLTCCWNGDVQWGWQLLSTAWASFVLARTWMHSPCTFSTLGTWLGSFRDELAIWGAHLKSQERHLDSWRRQLSSYGKWYILNCFLSPVHEQGCNWDSQTLTQLPLWAVQPQGMVPARPSAAFPVKALQAKSISYKSEPICSSKGAQGPHVLIE